MKVPVNEFDGKVIYGEKLGAKASDYKNHVDQLQQVLGQLTELESNAQRLFLNKYSMGN